MKLPCVVRSAYGANALVVGAGLGRVTLIGGDDRGLAVMDYAEADVLRGWHVVDTNPVLYANLLTAIAALTGAMPEALTAINRVRKIPAELRARAEAAYAARVESATKKPRKKRGAS